MAKPKDFTGLTDDSFKDGFQSEPELPNTPPKPILEEPKEELTRKTYYLTVEQHECIRVICYRGNKDISGAVRELLDTAIPEDIREEARRNLEAKKRNS